MPTQKQKQQRTALLSAYNKAGLEEFAWGLVALGWDLLGSSGTAKHLSEQGIPILDISEFVGEPILGHRVVTLSRHIHAALLATESVEDQFQLDSIGIPRIGLVYVDLYPLKEVTEKPDCTLESVIEATDIGGPTLLRSAAKGRRLVVSSPDQFPSVLRFIKAEAEKPNEEKASRFLSFLAGAAEIKVAAYCAVSGAFHSTRGADYTED